MHEGEGFNFQYIELDGLWDTMAVFILHGLVCWI